MIKTLTLTSIILLSGCTTFQLGTVHPAPGTLASQQQLDILTCKDQAVMAANAPGQQTKEFLLGFTIVGYPAAIKSDRNTQRSVFDACMSAKGYRVSH